MNEITTDGNWPANAIGDISKARDHLRDIGYAECDFVFVSHYVVNRTLECQISNTQHSYKKWLLHQGILHTIIINNSLERDTAYIYATKKGIPLIKTIEGLHVIPTDSIYKIINIVVSL